jgi:beta-galactosidase/beta-glucuronidase
MVYHDFMFGDGNIPVQGHFPKVDSKNQIEEIKYQTRRLTSHPSVVLWSSCNECGHLSNFKEKYVDFVLTQVTFHSFFTDDSLIH